MVDLNTLIQIVEPEQNTTDTEIRYKNGRREVKSLAASNTSEPNDSIKIKENGVYLITGGAGGLGLLFATHISKIKHTKLILTGGAKPVAI